jgi:hypothetical protein
MVIAFTAELSHYPSGGRYATLTQAPYATLTQAAVPRRLPTAPPSYFNAPSLRGGGWHTFCDPCSRDTAGACVADCQDCPAGELPDGPNCVEYSKACNDNECDSSKPEPCSLPSRAPFYCPTGTSCCNPDLNLCCTATNPQCCGSTCCAATDTCCSGVCRPPTTLQSNQNHLLVQRTPTPYPMSPSVTCENIKDLKVWLTATQDLVATATTPSTSGPPVVAKDGGFTFQLNAYNPAVPTTNTTWMQYVFWLTGSAINYQIQYWDLATACGCCTPTPTNPNPCPVGCTCPGGQTVNLADTVFALPSNTNTLPKGYTLGMELENDDNGNVVAVDFSVTDNTGKLVGSKTATLDASHQFPISAFEANVVGPDNSSNAAFPSGAGQIADIAYSSSNGLFALGNVPDALCGSPGSKLAATAETSNVTYSAIPSPCSELGFHQSVST